MVLSRINIFERIREREINAEIIATFLFILISGFYILAEYGIPKLLDALLLWMFPASIMVFLTLMIVKIIERLSKRNFEGHGYLDLRNA
ncbi:MAG: hypothetical protein AABY15_01285 [Nanoarchaeota archaeon]